MYNKSANFWTDIWGLFFTFNFPLISRGVGGSLQGGSR